MALAGKPIRPKPPMAANPRLSIPKMPKRNPRILGSWKVKPAAPPPGTVLKKRGGGLGWVAIKAPATAPATPKPPKPVIPYAEYADFPWAQRELAGIDREETAHEAYASTVGNWLGQSLNNLTGVTPGQEGLGPQLQQQYLANIAGTVGGALGAASVATPMTPMPTTGGALAIGNTTFLGNAAREAASERKSAALAAAQIQSTLNTLQPNTYAQGALRAYADMQAGLPALYAQKREDARNKIDQFITTATETARHNRVTEATNAWNAQTNAAIAFGKIGLDTSKLAFDQSAGSQPAPYGYLRDPASGRLVRDPSVPTASASGGGSDGSGAAAPSSARGQYAANSLRKQGFVGGWKVRPKTKPKGAKGTFTQATDGTWWIKPATARSASSAKPKAPKTTTSLQASLSSAYKPGGVGGIEYRHPNDPNGAAKEVVRWVLDNKSQFVIRGHGRAADVNKLNDVLLVTGRRVRGLTLDILKRGYINANGNWK